MTQKDSEHTQEINPSKKIILILSLQQPFSVKTAWRFSISSRKGNFELYSIGTMNARNAWSTLNFKKNFRTLFSSVPFQVISFSKKLV